MSHLQRGGRDFQLGDHTDRDGPGHAGRPAHRFGGTATTYRELDEQSGRFAAGLREAEAAVIGKPDERLGEEVVAVVALRPGCELRAEDVIAYCRERLAAYKYPREIRFMAELPKGPSGKILKSALRDA
jgi:acyl-CoA synthetase (AMP-forming)/AMP-acid ligase II